MRRVKISRKQWEGIGKKAGWMKTAQGDRLETLDTLDCNYLSHVNLKRVGNTMLLRVDEETLLYMKIEPLFQFLERIMLILREEQIEEREKEE